MNFPRAAKTITHNRQRWIANNFAASRMQELKAQPYAVLPITDSGSYFLNAGPGGLLPCDCKTAKFDNAALPEDAQMVEDGVTYTRKVCIGLVERSGSAWKTHCPADPLDSSIDKGLKNIRVQVSWKAGPETMSTEMEGMVSR